MKIKLSEVVTPPSIYHKQKYIQYLSIHSNPLFYKMKLSILEVFMFYHNANMLPPGDSFEISIGNYNPTEGIAFEIVGVKSEIKFSMRR